MGGDLPAPAADRRHHRSGRRLAAHAARPRRALSERPSSYRALKPPFFIVWGERDLITPLEQAERLTHLVPGARLTVMKGVGHIPQIEYPAGFDELLRRVIDEASFPPGDR